jgi:hypothetical protein
VRSRGSTAACTRLVGIRDRVVVRLVAVAIQWEGIAWGLAATTWLLLALLPRLVALRLPPPPGPPTLEPGPEPPAVASLLVFGARARHAAVAATVLDLGARGYLDLAWMGPSLLGCRAARAPEGSELLRFERRVLERLRTQPRCHEAPVSALLPTPRSLSSRRWYGGFAREVTTVARDKGLVSPQLAPGAGRLLLLAAVVPAGLPALFLWRSGDQGAAGEVATALVAAGVLLAGRARRTRRGATLAGGMRRSAIPCPPGSSRSVRIPTWWPRSGRGGRRRSSGRWRCASSAWTATRSAGTWRWKAATARRPGGGPWATNCSTGSRQAAECGLPSMAAAGSSG